MAQKTQDEKAKSQADKEAGERYQEKVSLTNKDVRRDETANQSDAEPEDDAHDKKS
jgi:hypothetical protein